MQNISVIQYRIWNSGSRGNAVLRHFISRALVATLFSRPEPFVQFW